MKKKPNTAEVELTDDQAIDAIHTISHTTRQPLVYQKIGRYGIVNPKVKSWLSIFEKLGRKTRTREDEVTHTETVQILNRYNKQEDKLFDLLRDWSRFTIIIPDYDAAPALIANFLAEFGGDIEIHSRPDYFAIHWHGKYKGVNVEVQFHTEKFAELKLATDAFYHLYKDVVIEKNSKIEDEYNRKHNDITQYCQIVYKNSNFLKNIIKVNEVVNVYKSRQKNSNNESEKLSHFVMYAKRAEMVQKELSEYLPQFLIKLDQMEKTKLVHNNQQSQEYSI